MSKYTAEQIQLINKTTTEFYSSVAESFSKTRQHEWDGWKNCLQFFHNGDAVLDLGCGNRRFSKFLEENDLNVKVDNVDNCLSMGTDIEQSMGTDIERSSTSVPIKKVDIIESLLEDSLNLNSYDVAVCFGVMHHVPTAELRLKLLEELTKSKIAIVSFWQFEKDERIFNKAQETTEVSKSKLGLQNLEENDYFLGWQDTEDTFRFCHNFTDIEVDDIISKFNVIDTFTADKLNKYLVLSK